MSILNFGCRSFTTQCWFFLIIFFLEKETDLQVNSRSPRQSSSQAWRLATRRRRLGSVSSSYPWTRSKLQARLQTVLAPTGSARNDAGFWPGRAALRWPLRLMRSAPRPSVTDSAGSADGVIFRQFFCTYSVKTGNCDVVRAPGAGRGRKRWTTTTTVTKPIEKRTEKKRKNKTKQNRREPSINWKSLRSMTLERTHPETSRRWSWRGRTGPSRSWSPDSWRSDGTSGCNRSTSTFPAASRAYRPAPSTRNRWSVRR